MKIQESAENYLETILILKLRNGYVRSIDVANELSFSKPSVSNAMKSLRQKNLIRMDNGGLIELTEEGHKIAQSVYERHVLIGEYLIAIGVTPDVAMADACRIEHVISEETFEKLKEHARKYER
ncbi:MAG: metal-dependent transcriptional regulator [Peptostreptococcaceae bacterium]|nr:metal-dependent transcriptional regulator [Peptostreptococcaceae bacterium]